MRVKIENKATSNIHDVRKNLNLLGVFGLVNYLHENYYKSSLTYPVFPSHHLKKKDGVNSASEKI